MAVDPADEFHSPYLYCANNPVNHIDPDGSTVLFYPNGDFEYVFDGLGFDVFAYSGDYFANFTDLGPDWGFTQIPIVVDAVRGEVNIELDYRGPLYEDQMGYSWWKKSGLGFIPIAIKADTRYWEGAKSRWGGTGPDPIYKTHYIFKDLGKWCRSDELNFIGIGALYSVNSQKDANDMIRDIYLWKLQYFEPEPSPRVLYWAKYGYYYF
ncbi:MAG: hypothetical protein K9J13_06175 [Saprospiraceae bacterium]|nr:hypothetical protein [Saprospiraceae bacterium]